MQTYTKIYHKRFPLWKKLNRKLSKDAKIIYMYLLSSPFTHHSGIFEYSETILVNTGLKLSEIEKGVSELSTNGLITVDEQLEYCLVTYLVENIKLDNKNMATSLIKYILDLEKTFLIGTFHQLIENTDIFNRIETVEEGLLNRYLTLSKQFANKDYTINTIDNRLNTIEETINNKDDKLEIIKEVKPLEKVNQKSISKQKEDLNSRRNKIKESIMEICNYYYSHIRPNKVNYNTKKDLALILERHTKENIINCIKNYSEKYKGDKEFILGINKFFNDDFFTVYLDSNVNLVEVEKEIMELKSQPWLFHNSDVNGKMNEVGESQVDEIYAKYNVKREDIIEAEFKVVEG